MGELIIAMSTLAANPPAPINLGEVTALLRAAWTVVLIVAAFTLFTAAKKGQFSTVVIGLTLFVLLSMVVYVPGVMQSTGTAISQFFS